MRSGLLSSACKPGDASIRLGHDDARLSERPVELDRTTLRTGVRDVFRVGADVHPSSGKWPTVQYRPEIDGLRAVCVLSVILYHARFTLSGQRLFQGGYLGVDLFFLISGFLIGWIVAAELREGRFSLVRFYERRARRILPALVCVLVASSLTASLLMSPGALREYAQSVVATVFFFSNIHFLFQDSYTAAPSQLQPLLHTWSLSVEEQFYLVLPLLLILAVGRVRWQVAGLILLSALSLLLASMLVRTHGAMAFFLPFSRAWELLAGTVLALLVMGGGIAPRGADRYLPSLGAAIVVLSIATFDEATPHPSVLTLMPILGGALLIGWANPRDPATRLLASRPFVAVGLASYSLYLWHFPIFAFLRIANDGSGTPGLMAFGIALTAVLSAATWRWVEQPFRDRSRVTVRVLLFATGLPLAATLVVSTVVLMRPLESDYPSIPSAVQASFTVFEPRSGAVDCIDQERFLDPSTWCEMGVVDSAPSFVLVGDSHAEALAASLDAAALRLRLSGRLIARSGCPLLLGLEPQRGTPLSQQCVDLAAAVLDYVRAEGIRTVVFASRWNYYTCGEPKPDCGYTQNIRVPGEAWAASLTQREQVLAAALRQTLSAYRDAGVELRFVAQVPHQLHDPRAVFEAHFAGQGDALDAMALPVEAHRAFGGRTLAMLQRAVSDRPGAAVLDPSAVLCADGGLCRFGTAEASFYSDDDHLSAGAARVLTDWAEGLLR